VKRSVRRAHYEYNNFLGWIGGDAGAPGLDISLHIEKPKTHKPLYPPGLLGTLELARGSDFRARVLKNA